MSKERAIEVVVMNRSGFFVAVCKELEISGFGETPEDALTSFQKALVSTVSARITDATSRIGAETWEQAETARFPLGAPVPA